MTRAPFDVTALLAERIRSIQDFPSPGVLFRDISPLLADHGAFAHMVDAIVAHHGRGTLDHVVGIEARGFIVAAPVAYHVGAGFVPVRKAGKLPGPTFAETYALEYGTATLEVQQDAVTRGARVLIVDDVLATGGTVAATAALLTRLGAQVVGVSVVVELPALGGRERLAGLDVHALIAY